MHEFPTKPTLQVMHFLVQELHICVDLQNVQKALLLPFLEMVPNSATCLAGLMNISGTSVPVIDLAILMNQKRTKPYTVNTPILLCGNEQQQIGLIIDQIGGLADIDLDTIQMHEDFDKANSIFEAVVVIDSELTMLLSIAHLLSINLLSKTDSFDANKPNVVTSYE